MCAQRSTDCDRYALYLKYISNVTLYQDMSADIVELARTPVAVVCAGVKTILDVPRTLEALETFGVPVVTLHYQQFPGFFSVDSGSKSPAVASSTDEVHLEDIQCYIVMYITC
jgi:pseudouridine-5'-phosphate glycosidase